MYRMLGACLCLACALAHGADAQPQAPCPLWDGHETIEQYAKRVNLSPTKTLDLGVGRTVSSPYGSGVTLELVLIPAGKFIMGTPEPVEPKETVFTGQAILVVAGAAAFGLVLVVIIRSIAKRRRPQFSLRGLLVFVITVGFAMLGGFRWSDVAKEWRRYELAKQVGSNERPAHEVTVTTPFYISKFETTQGQYQQVMGTNPSQVKGSNLPVETVSWDDAQDFCKKVAQASGLRRNPEDCATVRLPSEGEWEYACRAGTATAYCSGDEDADLDRVGWYAANSKNTTHPVGQKAPNAWGVYDMHGNVWEWCADWYEEYRPGAVVDPQGASQGQFRVLRGGSWSDDPWYCRSAYRIRSFPYYRYDFIGFRVVVLVPRTP